MTEGPWDHMPKEAEMDLGQDRKSIKWSYEKPALRRIDLAADGIPEAERKRMGAKGLGMPFPPSRWWFPQCQVRGL